MVTFSKRSRAELEEMASEQYRRHFPDHGPSQPPRNIGALLVLIGKGKLGLPYRGRMYELRPVSFEDGVRLAEVRSVFERIERTNEPSAEEFDAYLQGLRTVARMAKKYARPVGVVRRLLWTLRFSRNPFRRATEAELGLLLGFLLGCRMRSSVRYPGI